MSALSVGELWHLRPELEYTHFVDSWNVREAPSLDAQVIGRLVAGDRFRVAALRGDWVKLHDARGVAGWSYIRYRDVDALAPVDGARSVLVDAKPSPELRPPKLQRVLSKTKQEYLRELLAELSHRRRKLDALDNVADDGLYVARARAAAAVQDTMATLELLGVSPRQVLSLEGADALEQPEKVERSLSSKLQRTDSYGHSDFVNPHAESCWLSSFFQSLWHSRVFHTAFEQAVKPLTPDRPASKVAALQQTWQLYERAAASGQAVSVSALVQAWGDGYGDSAEAFGKLQSDNELAVVADLFGLVPLPYSGYVPRQQELLEAVTAMGCADKPLVAIDIVLPALSKASIYSVAQGIEGDRAFASGHSLVALICYMDNFRHYVVFCRGLSGKQRWLFFNDLPGLARGTPKELEGWDSVVRECAAYELCPRMLLYESTALAGAALKRALAAKDEGSERCNQM